MITAVLKRQCNRSSLLSLSHSSFSTATTTSNLRKKTPPVALRPKPIPIPPLPIFPPTVMPKTPRHPPIEIPPHLLPANSNKANQFRARALKFLEEENPLKVPKPEIHVSHPMDKKFRRREEVAHMVDIPGRDQFVVVDVNTRQFKVMKGDAIMVSKLKKTDVGDKITFKKVLLLGTLNNTIIGRPYLDHVKVSATVEEHTKLGKVIAFKKKRRKRYKKHKGHRDKVTVLRINDIITSKAEFEKPDPGFETSFGIVQVVAEQQQQLQLEPLPSGQPNQTESSTPVEANTSTIGAASSASLSESTASSDKKPGKQRKTKVSQEGSSKPSSGDTAKV